MRRLSPSRARALAKALTGEFWAVLQSYLRASAWLGFAAGRTGSQKVKAALWKAINYGDFPAWAFNNSWSGVFGDLSDKVSDAAKLTEKEENDARNCK